MERDEQRGTLVYLPIQSLFPHPDNPRKELGELSELAESIKAKGIMQNLTVVPMPNKMNPTADVTGKYVVIIGHRRMAAAKLAGLRELPCVIVEMSEKDQVATMLLENMQRSDLTPFEQAQGMQMMLDLGESVDGISEKTGFSKSTVRRRLEMAKLDKQTLKKVSGRQLSLMDFDRLSEIRDIKARNAVLEHIGTNNFESELLKARAAEKEKADKERWHKAMADFGAIHISEKEGSGAGYKAVAAIPITREASTEKILGEPPYYYYIVRGYIFVKNKKTKEEISSLTDRDRKEAEDKAELERKKAALAEASERGHELRRKFVLGRTEEKMQEYLALLVESIAVLFCHEYSMYSNGSSFAKLAGTDFEPLCEQTARSLDFSKRNSALALLYRLFVMCDGSSPTYYAFNAKYHKNESFEVYIDLLEHLGYWLSDEERALLNGTSELYVKEGAVS